MSDKPNHGGPVIDTSRPQVPRELIATGLDVGRKTESSAYTGSTGDPYALPGKVTHEKQRRP